MLEHVFRDPQVNDRIRSNPIGSTLENYAAYLVERGYARVSTRRYVYAAEHFGWWLGSRPISLEAVENFVMRHLPACRCQVWAGRSKVRVRMGLNRLLEMMGLPAEAPAPASSTEALLRRYSEHMTQVQGLATTTIAHRVRCARELMTDLRIRDVRQLTGLTADRIAQFVTKAAQGFSPGTGQLLASSIRSFLRYLLLHKMIKRDLSITVPSFACWRLASLPTTVSAAELERLIDSVDIVSPVGLRDRAILLCLIDLGMRASEVTDLEVDGVDLTRRVLHLRCRKQRRPLTLPMTPRLATAIGQYVRRGRPRIETSAALFVRHRAPGGGFVTCSGVQCVVRRRAVQAGLARRGTHVIRHSVASQMINTGATLKQIADLLGHRSLDTTAIYAKVDMASLRKVALPWPAREVTP